MKIEHFALNVSDPIAMAEWYCSNLNMTVKRASQQAPFAHFLADSSGSVMIEIYKNPADAVPNYAQMDPLLLHLAFVSLDPESDKERLVQAGCTVVDEIKLDDGSHLVMLRDPWGLALQLCKRGTPML
ncbi:MAG: VOC family protein [Gammaproteobacteria bacterium]|nr:VOC family protein [Gammaproteobacteria bacterium]